MEYRCALSSAKEFSVVGKLEEWVHAYLLSDGCNKELSDGLKLCDRYYIGPVKMPLKLFKRYCGPEEEMKYQVKAEYFESRVAKLMEAIQKEKDMPPMIIHYVNGDFELSDGNHRYEAYSRLGINECDVIVWITEKSEYDEFLEKYSVYAQ